MPRAAPPRVRSAKFPSHTRKVLSLYRAIHSRTKTQIHSATACSPQSGTPPASSAGLRPSAPAARCGAAYCACSPPSNSWSPSHSQVDILYRDVPPLRGKCSKSGDKFCRAAAECPPRRAAPCRASGSKAVFRHYRRRCAPWRCIRFPLLPPQSTRSARAARTPPRPRRLRPQAREYLYKSPCSEV